MSKGKKHKVALQLSPILIEEVSQIDDDHRLTYDDDITHCSRISSINHLHAMNTIRSFSFRSLAVASLALTSPAFVQATGDTDACKTIGTYSTELKTELLFQESGTDAADSDGFDAG